MSGPPVVIWRAIPGVERYEVSIDGRVRHKDNQVPLRLQENWKGYSCFYYRAPGRYKRRKKMFVHRAVALAFVPNPRELPSVDHRDRDRSNNWWLNLEWACPMRQNNNRSYR
jgi:hypothetical protein